MGPLSGIKIIEFAGIGPCPMAAMMLAEMGATVLRIDRVADSDLGIPLATKFETLKRSRHIAGPLAQSFAQQKRVADAHSHSGCGEWMTRAAGVPY